MVSYFLPFKSELITKMFCVAFKIDGEKIETVADFIFLGSKITADGDRSHEIKSSLLLGSYGKAMANLLVVEDFNTPFFSSNRTKTQDIENLYNTIDQLKCISPHKKRRICTLL